MEEGAEITIVLPEWGRLTLIAGGIMEVALHGSSLGLGTEEWFAMSIDSVSGTAATGFCVAGTLMGCEAEGLVGEVAGILEDGAVHLCAMDPCGDKLHAIHATRIRLWKPSNFDATYLSGEGQRLLKRLQETEKKEAAALSGPTQPRKRPAASRGGTAPARRKKAAEDTETGAIPVTSGEEEEEDAEDVDDPSAGASRAGLRELLKKTKERILGGNRPVRRAGAEEDVSGGRPPARTRPAAGRSGPVSQWDGPQTWEDNALWPDATGGYKRRWYAHFEEEEEELCRGRYKLAGSGRAGVSSRCPSEKGKEAGEGQGEPHQTVGGALEGKEQKEKEQEGWQVTKGPTESQGLDRHETRSRRSRPRRLVQQYQRNQLGRRRGAVRGRVGPQLRTTLAQESAEGSGLGHGNVGKARSATTRPWLSDGHRGRRRSSHLRGEDSDLLCAAHKAIPSAGITAAEGALFARTEHRSSSSWSAARDGRRPCVPFRGRAYGIDRRGVGHSFTAGTSPARTRPISQHGNHAGGSEASKAGAQEPRPGNDLMVEHQRQGQGGLPLPREGQEGRWQSERSRKRTRLWQGCWLERVKRRKQSMERKQGGSPQEIELQGDDGDKNSMQAILQVGLAQAVPLPIGLERGIFRLLAARCNSFRCLGRAMLWMFLRFPGLERERSVPATVRHMFLGKSKMDPAMHRSALTRCRSLFPLPVGDVSKMKAAAEALALDDFCTSHFAILDDVEVWTMLTVLGLNGLAGFGRATGQGRPSEPQRRALECLRQSTSRVPSPTLRLDRTAEEAEKELAGRFVTYTGEEVPKMQTIRFDAAVAALPPQSHGGSIDVLKLVSDGTRSFLENPEKSLLSQPKMDVKLQAKVHIKPEEALPFCQELVSRNICTWVSHDAVLRVNGECVLNGMFAVGKNTYLDSGFEVQRTIMNLIPSNSCFRQAEGATHELPSICQYLSLVLDGSSKLAFFQSDMSSAFYLFRIPKKWSRMLSFNIDFDGECLGLKKGVRYHPACSVIPMGWHSAVSIMQEVADKLTALGQLPKENMVRRNIPLPPWLTDVLTEGSQKQKPWYHVYLDNFCAMQRTADRNEPEEVRVLHEELEQAWNDAGVLSSAKKRVSGAIKVDELGARLEGEAGTIGPSPERLLRLLQTTLVIISKTRLRRKWVQVVAGRWVHCMSFRRPTMVLLDRTWQYISEQSNGPNVEAWVRTELFGCCMVALMMHTNLRAVISETTTASDASSTGGAVGKSTELSSCGTEFAAMDASGLGTGKVIPVLVLSLFNGIGCCFRAYDLCGVLPQVAIAYELSGPANRVTSRRWPHVQIEKDVRDINEETIRQWRYRYPGLEELHLWGGFPCVDLSRVKAGRMNLEGAESGLFYEIPRILKEIRKVFGYHFKVRYCVENVASMDEAAEAEISRALLAGPLGRSTASPAALLLVEHRDCPNGGRVAGGKRSVGGSEHQPYLSLSGSMAWTWSSMAGLQ